jgi:hypothetical protein
VTLQDDAKQALRVARVAVATAEAVARAAGVKVAREVVTAERINLVGPDGGLRLVIAANTHEIYARGKVIEHPGRAQPGLIFVNSEGTECGGITWDTDGGSFTIDSHEQDQAIAITHHDDNGVRSSVVEFVDRPAWSLFDVMLGEKKAERPEDVPVTRMRLAKEADGSVGLTLNDRDGRPRLRLQVAANGKPLLEMLDEDGKPV